MTDRADEIAREIVGLIELQGDGEGGYWVDNIDDMKRTAAAALRSYRNEGLEEAAEMLEAITWHRISPREVGELIRSLKSKEPQG